MSSPLPVHDPSGAEPDAASAAPTAPTPAAPPAAPAAEPPASTMGMAVPAPDGTPPAVTLDQVKLALRRVKDPELNLNIVDLGLVYEMGVVGGTVLVDMSLTSPGCPSGPDIMKDAEDQLRTLPGVTDVQMNLVWSPPWTPERIEPRVRAYLGF